MARKTLSFTNQKVLEKLKLEPNESRYVQELILNDMNNKPKITEKDIMNLIKRYIRQEKINPQISEGEKEEIL